MPSEKVRQIISQFRASFQGEEFDLPVSLRQESPDIVFKALLENDENPMPPVTPLVGYGMEDDSAMDMSQMDMTGDLLSAAGIPPEALGGAGVPGGVPGAAPGPQGQPAPAQPQPQGAAPQPSGGGNPLDDLMGLI